MKGWPRAWIRTGRETWERGRQCRREDYFTTILTNSYDFELFTTYIAVAALIICAVPLAKVITFII